MSNAPAQDAAIAAAAGDPSTAAIWSALGQYIGFALQFLTSVVISRVAYGLIWIAIYARFMQGVVGFRWRHLAGIYARSTGVALATAAPSLAIYRYWRTPDTLGWDGFLAAVMAGFASWVLALLLTRHAGLDDLLGMVRHTIGHFFCKPAPRAP